MGIPVATAAALGVEAFAPAIAAWLGLGGSAAEVVTNAARGAASEARVLRDLGLARNTRSVITAEGRSIPDALTDTMSVEIEDLNICQRNQTTTDPGCRSRSFRATIGTNYWNENENKWPRQGLI